ncbi:MAG: nicotinate (nicotinamide) nucleotide adenylyltransferase [Chloroherpetonaceae bacterium]|nr:nicotinate (nicotinamide) nucleotide adenylyltransferase [Chloroherpetonaceae bacterium]
MMHIALFGGSFDPPHLGHFAMALLIRELFSPDQILLSVSQNPFKTDSSAETYHRVEMTKLMARELNKTGEVFEVFDWELSRPAPSFTIDTIRYIHGQNPTAQLTLCIGEDNFNLFSKWKNYEKILTYASLAVFKRPSQNGQPINDSFLIAPEDLERKVTVIDFNSDFSSSEIRKNLATGESVDEGLLPEVLQYLRKHCLYNVMG